jgi:hypothetical protein
MTASSELSRLSGVGMDSRRSANHLSGQCDGPEFNAASGSRPQKGAERLRCPLAS